MKGIISCVSIKKHSSLIKAWRCSDGRVDRDDQKKQGTLGKTSLVAQWLRLCAPNAGGLGSIPGQGVRFHVPQLRIRKPQLKDPTGCTKTWRGQINKCFRRRRNRAQLTATLNSAQLCTPANEETQLPCIPTRPAASPITLPALSVACVSFLSLL